MITGDEEEEENLNDSVVTLLVSYYYVYCGFVWTQEHSSRHQSPQFSYLRLKLQAAKAACNGHGIWWERDHSSGSPFAFYGGVQGLAVLF